MEFISFPFDIESIENVETFIIKLKSIDKLPKEKYKKCEMGGSKFHVSYNNK